MTDDLPNLILSALAVQPLHGYALARAIEQRDSLILRRCEGMIYPALRGLEQEGLIVGTWESQPPGADQRVYRLTKKGGGKLAQQARAPQRAAKLIRSLGSA